MTETDQDVLQRECGVFTRYLAGSKPPPYVVQKYIDFHQQNASALHERRDRFDDWLLRFARLSKLTARLADCYSSRLYKDAVIRGKLVLLLAILECTPPLCHRIDRANQYGRWMALLDMSIHAGSYAIFLMVAIVTMAPVHLLLRQFASAAPRSTTAAEGTV